MLADGQACNRFSAQISFRSGKMCSSTICCRSFHWQMSHVCLAQVLFIVVKWQSMYDGYKVHMPFPGLCLSASTTPLAEEETPFPNTQTVLERTYIRSWARTGFETKKDCADEDQHRKQCFLYFFSFFICCCGKVFISPLPNSDIIFLLKYSCLQHSCHNMVVSGSCVSWISWFSLQWLWRLLSSILKRGAAYTGLHDIVSRKSVFSYPVFLIFHLRSLDLAWTLVCVPSINWVIRYSLLTNCPLSRPFIVRVVEILATWAKNNTDTYIFACERQSGSYVDLTSTGTRYGDTTSVEWDVKVSCRAEPTREVALMKVGFVLAAHVLLSSATAVAYAAV
jgi:hypothetical protein